MRSGLSLALVLLMLETQLPAQQSSTDLRDRIAGLPQGSLVEVRTTSGERIRGRIASRTDSDFSLHQNQGHATRTVAYAQVLSVSRMDAHSKRKWIILGAVLGTLLVCAIIVYNGLTRD